MLSMWFPDGIRGPENPQIYPGLYAVVGEWKYIFINQNIIKFEKEMRREKFRNYFDTCELIFCFSALF